MNCIGYQVSRKGDADDGEDYLSFFVSEFGGALFFRSQKTDAHVAKYAMAKKNTETEISRLKPPTRGAAKAAINAVMLWMIIDM